MKFIFLGNGSVLCVVGGWGWGWGGGKGEISLMRQAGRNSVKGFALYYGFCKVAVVKPILIHFHLSSNTIRKIAANTSILFISAFYY